MTNLEEKKIRIAIDGPAGAGKSTVAKLLAEKLSYIYVDTGAMYRAFTYKAIKQQVNLQNEEELAKILENTTITLKPSDNGQLVFIDGQNVTNEIRTATVTKHVSTVASYKLVREFMVAQQKQMGKTGGIIMDGRDIGTSVLPHAELKIFLTADVSVRAERRHLENLQKGYPSDLETLKKEIQLRDLQDMNREISPLRKASDAIEIDTSTLTIEEVVDKIYELAIERMKQI